MVFHRPLIALLGACVSVSAMAAEVNLSGFGSFIGGISDHEGENVQYRDYVSNDLEFSPNSLAGIQIDGALTPRTSMTLQMLAQGVSSWDAQVNWAYVRHAPTETFSLKFGRMNLPLFLYSDTMQVGYSYPWLTPPEEVYNVPLESTDGMGVVFNQSFGAVDLQWEGYVGSANFTLPTSFLEDIPVQVRNQAGGALDLFWQHWRIRLGAHTAELTIEDYATELWQGVKLLSDTLRRDGYVSASDNLLIEEDDLVFTDAAILYDDGTWIGVFEYKDINAHRDMPIPRERGAYAMAGRRFSSHLLHLTRSFNPDGRQRLTHTVPADYASSNGINRSTLDMLEANLVGDNDSWILGWRWDFEHNVAFKSEVSVVDDNKPVPSYFTGGGDYTLVRFGMQAVF